MSHAGRARRIRQLVFSLAAVAGGCGAAAGFRFTATSDSRSPRLDLREAFAPVRSQAGRQARSSFRHCLSQINERVGSEGVFHVSIGDIDPPGQTWEDIVDTFGADTLWYPVVGNHDAATAAYLDWIRVRFASLPRPLHPGPPGCETTTYSFDRGSAHFVVLNEYYDGRSDAGTDGDVGGGLCEWLAADLAASAKPVKIVFGHEPAFPFERHIGDSLDKYPDNRDRFWALLERERVAAYVCGHTHYYSRYRPEGGNVWQINLGNAGNDQRDGQTFLACTVRRSSVRFDVWRGRLGGEFALEDRWTAGPRRR